jgi:hypothetical protein
MQKSHTQMIFPTYLFFLLQIRQNGLPVGSSQSMEALQQTEKAQQNAGEGPGLLRGFFGSIWFRKI